VRLDCDPAFDGLYYSFPGPDKEVPSNRFTLSYPSVWSSNQLWTTLSDVVSEIKPSLMHRVTALRADSVTTHSYGPSVRDFIDHHGYIIRTAGDPANILSKVASCKCSEKFSKFVDPAVGHVRTQDTAVLPSPLRGLVAMGLNFRPRLKTTMAVALDSAYCWAGQVCWVLVPRRGAHATLTENILWKFYSKLRRNTSARQRQSVNSGLDENVLKAQGLEAASVLACISTDKAANTATFECVHWYRAVCVNRLIDSAFVECGDQQVYSNLFVIAGRWTPWADLSDSRDAILFCTPKMHKREADRLAYRFITNACSALSKPVSLEVTRVLTILNSLVRQHCIDLGSSMGAKLWWQIDSLDTVPFNLDCSHRPNRSIAAFDVDKCYECVPLFEGVHSLLSHLDAFLDLAFQGNEFLGSSFNWRGTPKAEGHWCRYKGGADVTYSRKDVHDMVSDLLQMTVVTVGSEARKQDLGLPMGFSSSGILLNIYLFIPEYRFVLRLARLRPDLLHVTHELFRYIDDLGCFGDVDMALFLDVNQDQSEENPFWIYPLAPSGPLGIKDQTLRTPESTTVVYLDCEYTTAQGYISFGMHFKGDNLPFKLLRFTHWSSQISRACKIGMILAQTRTACRSASSTDRRFDNLEKIRSAFLSIGYPVDVVNNSIDQGVSVYSQRFPALQRNWMV
jgi:hypothetical protein